MFEDNFMEIRQLKTFVAIKEKGTYVQAADFLAYTQPTLTAHIQSLEAELGINLFDKLGHRVRLTREGELFYTYAERILKLIDEATDAVTHKMTENSRIIIGVSETFSVIRLPLILREFRKENPNVAVELKFGDLRKFQQDLNNNEIDLAFLLAEKTKIHGITSKILAPEPMSLIASPESNFAKKHAITVNDFSGETVIATQEGCAYRKYVEDLLSKNQISPKAYMKVKNIEAIKQFVVSGLGIAVLPKIYVEKEILNGLVVELPWDFPDFGLFTQLAYHKDKWLSPVAQQFVRTVEKSLTRKAARQKGKNAADVEEKTIESAAP